MKMHLCYQLIYYIPILDSGFGFIFPLRVNMGSSPAPFSDIGKKAKGIPTCETLKIYNYIFLPDFLTWACITFPNYEDSNEINFEIIGHKHG